MLGKENKEEQVTGNQSSLIRMQEDTLLSSSQQMPIDLDLPEGFIIGKATDEGDCFFHAVAQGLKHLKPDINFTIKSLRNTCKAFAQSQLNLDSSWFIQALKDNKQDINYYLSFIEFTEGDMEKGPKVINKEIVLTTPIWGLPEIEGRIICIVYKVRLHFIEKHITRDGENVIMHHLIDREGYQKDALDREIFNKEVYYRKDTIHIINEGNLHFEPILRGEAQRILLHYYNTMASEKKSDSESVYFRQNFEAEMKDVTDNQMDCEYYKKPSPVVEVLPADSTTGTIIDDEDRLSDEELQYKQSQESLISFRVASSSSTSKDISDSVWYSTLTNCRSTVDDIGFTDDRIGKRATFFVKIFTREFEKKVREYSEEAKPNSNMRKLGKFTTESDFAIKSSAGPGLSVPTVDPISLGGQVFYAAPKKIFDIYLAKGHKKKAKVISEVIHSLNYDQKKILIEAGLEIFQSFEGQFVGVTDVGSSFWERGIEKLAIDAVSRVINYVSTNSEEKIFSVDLITKGLILGESKDNTLVQCVFHKPVELLMKNNDTCIGPFLNKLKMRSNLRKLQLGYRIQDGQNLLVTSQLYKGVGIERKDNNTTSHYQSKKYNYAEEYGYRLPFAWELEKWSNESIEKEYKLVTTPKGRYVYILDNGKKEKLANSILKEINGKDLAQKKDIEELCEKIENFQKNKEENICPFLFNIGPLPRLFVKRRRMLLDLANMLDKESQELEMSRMVLISGKHGTGKSELAKSYAYDKKNGTWKNIIWIDAEMPSILLSSFHRLAQELEISIEKGKGIERIDVKVKTERQPEKKIKSIIEDIYKNFRDARSLFIFDNVSNYKDIEEFLPSYFFHLFAGREKPYVLITSHNKDWKEEIEKINLDKGFTLSEAIDFIETALGIDGRLCDADLITKLAKTLHYSPLALKRATSCIREEGGSISQYLERYSKVMQESSLDYLKEQNISPELFTTFKINFDKIKEEKNVGQQSHDILASMAYLSPGPIDTAEFFFQEESEKDQQNASDALSLLDKFSVIKLEESIARVHMLVQKTIRLEKEQEGEEEEILRKIMTSIMDSDTTNIDHIVSVWSYASKYKELVNDFINSTYNGNTILHLLAISNNKEVIELILDKIDPNKLSKVINAVDKKKCAPLDYAAIYGHLEMVKYFIEEGSDLDIGSNRDLIPLHWAALHGQLEVVKHFIDNEYWGVDKLSGESGAPLHYAVISGNIDIVRYLVVKGADVNLQDESTGPLHYAVQEGHLDIVQYLIKKGAGVNLRDKNGMYPLHYAIKNGFLDIAKCLIDKGANINLRDRDNMSPLCYANESDRLDMIKYLVKEKAIANLCKKNVANSLYYGTENDRLDIAKCLIKEKISIILNNFDEVSMSFFYCDDLHDRLNNIKSLIMRSTMVDPLNKEGMSSLHLAIIYGRLDLIDQFAREEEADVNEQVREGMCLLHIAAACNHLDIIDYLVKKGANINEQNREGLSPLHIAVIHAHPGIVKYLIEEGADINLNDRCGMSPLFYALAITIGHPRISFDLIKYSSSLAQGIDVESVFNNLLHNDNPNVICYPEAQPSALDLRVQSHKRHRKGFTYSSKSKKRKLENISAIPKENASNVELLQGSQNLPLDVSMQFEGLADRMKDMVEKSMNNINSEMPACSFNSIAVESVNNKNLRR